MDTIIGRLSEWDAADAPMAPLSNQQLDCLRELEDSVGDRQFPSHITKRGDVGFGDTASSRSDGRSSARQASSSRGGQQLSHPGRDPEELLARGDGGDEDGSDGLFPAFAKLELGNAKIDTGQQFLKWIHQVESSLIEEESLPYRLYIAELERQRGVTLELHQQVSSSLAELTELNSQYESVSLKTTQLHDACQHLLQEQTQLAEKNSKLQDKLGVFQEYEKLQHKLGSPTLSVQSESFLPLLSKIDESIAVLNQNHEYKESSVYLVKYRALLSRALDMIRTYVKSCLDSATAAASLPATPAIASAPHTAFTLFYGKFRATAPRIRHLIVEAERRKEQGQEYEHLLNDLEAYYLACRERLLGPSVKSAVTQLLGVHSRDHCGLVRAGCAFLLHVCEDETQLHVQIFSPVQDNEGDPRPALTDFLERLCLVLYDSLRPLIIQVSHLETLAELTAILRVEVLGQHCQSHPHLVAYQRVSAQLLQDVQERLVYRTSVYIRTDIIGYSPSPGDLAYPEKLEMMESIAESLAAQQQENLEKGHSRHGSSSSIVSITSMEVGNITSKVGGGAIYSSHSPADLHGMWYPPVRRTLLTLSKLYRCLERPIFQGLSQEILSACLESIQRAASGIADNPKKTKFDGQLFEIKHLLILREQIVPFQVEFQVKETSLDFSKIKNAAVTLYKKRGEILSLNQNNALLEFLLEGTPGVQEHLRDSKKEVDRRLKYICEQFIQDVSEKMIGEILAFTRRVDRFNSEKPGSAGQPGAANAVQPLSSQAWAAANLLHTMVATSIRIIKSQVPAIQRKMQLYLANRETEFILFRPIRSSVVNSYITLLSILKSEYSSDQQTVVACPTQEQLAAILTSVMLKPKTPSSLRSSLSRETSYSREVSVDRELPDSPAQDKKDTNDSKANGSKNDNPPKLDKDQLREEQVNGVPNEVNGNPTGDNKPLLKNDAPS